MRFTEVCEKGLQKGLKVRRKVWKSFNGFLYLNGDDLIYSDNTISHNYILTLRNILREDWEIIEEGSLSDKIETNPFLGASIRFKDIKEYVGLILSDINTFDVEPCCHGIQQRDIINILKKRLGNKLI